MPETTSEGGWLLGPSVGFGFVHQADRLPRDPSPVVSPLDSSEIWWGVVDVNGVPVNTQFNMAFLWGRIAQEQHELKIPLPTGADPLSSEAIMRMAR